MKTKLLFFGDLFYDYELLQSDIYELSKWIQDNNYVSFGNLEGCLAHSDTRIQKRGPNLKGSSYTIDVCKLLNVKGLFLANNHMMDFGESGLKDTIELLDANEIQHCGAGVNIDKAFEPMIINVEEKKIGFLNFGWNVEETVYATKDNAGCAPREKSYIIEKIKKLRDCVDYIVISLHWGFEYNRLPMPADIELAHNIIDAGADLIIGHHSHCIQPMEKYKGKYIFYSLGNFYFGTIRDEYTLSFKEKISNQSDYGLVVAINFETNDIDFRIVYYDKNKKISCYKEKNYSLIEDITNINYKSFDYYLKVLKRRNNINPVLRDNEFVNELKLRFLNLFYIIKNIVKIIIKRN